MKKSDRWRSVLGRVRKLKGEISSWKSKLSDLQNDYNRREVQWNYEGQKNEKYERQARENVRKSLDLQYLEVSGKMPILWVNSPDSRVVNHGTFANIADRLRRIAPDIEMIVLTYGDVRLWELSDEDLNRVGLARIVDHPGGTIGDPKTKRLEEKA